MYELVKINKFIFLFPAPGGLIQILRSELCVNFYPGLVSIFPSVSALENKHPKLFSSDNQRRQQAEADVLI